MSAESDIAQLKAALRARIQATLTSLNAADGVRWSERIFERVIGLPEFENAQSVLSYVSMGQEVGTHGLIRHCLRVGKRVCVPRFDRKQKRYFVIAIEDFDRDLVPGYYGILEPRDARPTEEQADIAFVPGIAFDSRGNRLGRGKGYYDAMLTGFRGQKIALAFDFQFVDSVPAIAKDVPMDVVVTEERVHRCS